MQEPKYNELGSEFWIENKPPKIMTEREKVYCLSGRTAIDLILQDISRKKDVKSVAMPAWCCDSMIAPFLAHGIDVRFYDYDHTDYYLTTDITENTDIFYLTNYFGYKNTLNIEIVRKIKESGSIILYDRTHSFLMDDKEYKVLSDYSFASIRKWMGVIDGAVVEGIEPPELKDCPYISIKEKAMRDKYRYLMGDSNIKKEEFLAAFGEFGHQLAEDYCNYAMDDLSYTLYKQEDLQKMTQIRRENAAYIHINLEGVQFMYEFTDKSVPLFVPVLFESKEQRDYVRKKLIEQQIYCPVHWPQPKQIPTDYKVNDIVSRELSLICDQRYGINEIKREIETIMQLI
jgi:dTDP-4-amino-4,6-dideoxygalactose transaminase